MKTKLLLILCLPFMFSGCLATTIGFSRVTATVGIENRFKMQHRHTGREIVFVNMIHVEKPEFFEEVRVFLDSLKNDGYVVFYEVVGYDGIDSMRLDTMKRKLRRMIGREIGKSYADMIGGQNRYVKQTAKRLGLTTEKDIWADMYIDDLVEKYEYLYGEIELSDYDWSTPLDAKYKKRKAGKKHSDYHMTRTIREQHVIDMVEKSDYPKIVILYGERHKWGFHGHFSKSGYKMVEGKVWRSQKY